MAEMGFLKIGSHVMISFKASHSNTGHSHLIAGFTPENDHTEQLRIFPGASREIEYDPLPEAEQLTIHIKVPTGGSGILTVFVNGVEKDRANINRETFWDYFLTDKDLTDETFVINEEE